MITAARPPFIETVSGRRFQPLNPDPAGIDVTDIAHALANQCRYSGHTRVHYSVAEHSVRVSELLEAWGADAVVQLWGLLHDASEAYLVDIPSPLKSTEVFAAYRDAERVLMKAVCVRFALPLEEPPAVREADMKLLATEVRDLMPARPEHWSALKYGPLPDTVVPWGPDVAKTRFLDRFKELTQ